VAVAGLEFKVERYELEVIGVAMLDIGIGG